MVLMSTCSACASRVRPRFPSNPSFQLTFRCRNLRRTSRTLRLCALCTTRCESDTTWPCLRDRVVRWLGSLRDRRNLGPLLRRPPFPCGQQRETPDETGQSPRRSGEDRAPSRGYIRFTKTDLCRVSAFSEIHSSIQELNVGRNQNAQVS